MMDRSIDIVVRGDGLPPMAEPLLVNDRGEAWVPLAFQDDAYVPLPICHGLALAWTSFAPRIAILCLNGGNKAAPTDEQLCVQLTQDGLRRLIRDLLSIDEQLGEPA